MPSRKSIHAIQFGGGAGGQSPRTHPTRPAVGSVLVNAARTSNRVSTDDEIIRQVLWLSLRLEVIHRTAMSTRLALQLHGFSDNPDIAECLRAGVCDPLARQIRLAQSILEQLGAVLL
jgi:hypothetical protein